MKDCAIFVGDGSVVVAHDFFYAVEYFTNLSCESHGRVVRVVSSVWVQSGCLGLFLIVLKVHTATIVA